MVNTNLFYRNGPALLTRLAKPLAQLGYWSGRLKRPEEGAETAVYLARHDFEPNGEYWADKSVRSMNPIARNVAFAHEFWDWSAGLVPPGE